MASRRTLQLSRTAVRAFHTRSVALGGGGHAPDSNLHYEPGPTTDHHGRLGNIPLGHKLKLSYPEYSTALAMFAGLAILFIGLYYKPDYSVNTWGVQEYLRRTKARGEETPVDRINAMLANDRFKK